MAKFATLAVLMLLLTRPGSALDPGRHLTQYGHSAWRLQDGYLPSLVSKVAQTGDGYLWLGTRAGLFRFDGVRFVQWRPREGRSGQPSVTGLFSPHDGSLWVSGPSGLMHLRNDGRVSTMDLANAYEMAEDREGAIWVTMSSAAVGRKPLCRIKDDAFRCYGKEDGLPFATADPIQIDPAGDVWISNGIALARWNPRWSRTYTTNALQSMVGQPGIQHFALAKDGSVWVAEVAGFGLQRLVNGSFQPVRISGFDGSQVYATYVYADRHDSMWVGTNGGGLYRIAGGRAEHLGKSDGLSGDRITRLFEDHEGDLWVATTDGIDCLRDRAAASFSAAEGLSSTEVDGVIALRSGGVLLSGNLSLDAIHEDGGIRSIRFGKGLPGHQVAALLEDHEGRVWAGIDDSLYVVERGKFQPIRMPDGSNPGLIVGMTEDLENSIWAEASGKTRRLIRIQNRHVQESWPSDQVPAAHTLAADPRGGIWLGLMDGNLARFVNRKLEIVKTPVTAAGYARQIVVDSAGSVMAAAPSGLIGISGGVVRKLSARNGLPCDSVSGFTPDRRGGFWIYLDCGLARIEERELRAWWQDPETKVHPRVFDAFDGVRAYRVSFSPMAMSNDGRVWFANTVGVQMIDPARLNDHTSPPPVHIEEVKADGKLYEPARGLRLPALVRDVSINYTALSLAAPEKVRFRYKLEGQDPDWKEVVNDREVEYSNLPPRRYRFRVIASNSSGVWNEAGDVLNFSITPAYYQTNWFRALLAATVLALMGAAYQFRLWQLQRESRRLRDVIETIPAYVWSALPDGFVDFVNRRWLEFSGFSLDQAKGWGWAGAVHPEDRSRLLEAFRTAIASGKPLEEEGRMRRADGQYRWLLFRSVPQRDGSGKIVKWYGKSMDIDDRKRAEETLRETETRFRTYIDHATDAFFVLDFEGGTILDVNRRACENLGYTREELIGKTVFEFEAGLNPEWLERKIRPRIEAGESVTFETRHRRKNGTVFPVEIRARGFQTGGRTVNLSLVQDITDRKRAEEERERLRQMEIDLAHINRVSMMGELAASVAHEVNQPLAGIVSNGSAGLRFLTGDTPDVEEAVEALRDIVRDGKRAGEIIKRIRALTKRADTPRERLDLNETILDVLALVGDEAKKNSVMIRTQFGDEVYAVQGDRVQLQQVLLNLVMNAIQAMSSVSERERQLVIATRNIDHQVQVTVEDSGTGLDPDKIDKIFEPFYTTKSGGMGMGLSICRSILQNHGGRLWATANEGPGATFHFTLPKHREEGEDAGAAAG